ncbi:LuxR C-terminal-related transcriptional regulator [Leptolyngbyaceae cyanobacterium UHCC 1019]
MTSPLLTQPVEPSGLGSLLSYRAPRRQASHLSAVRATLIAQRPCDRPTHVDLGKDLEFSKLSRQLLELMPQGVLVVSRNFHLLYCNQKATEICCATLATASCSAHLPSSIVDACHRLIRDRADQRSLVQDYLAANGQTIRMTVQWLENASDQKSRVFDKTKLIDRDRDSQEAHEADLGQSLQTLPSGQQALWREARSPIVIFLENCDEVLQQDLRVQRKKYDLTERESEIWLLLRKEHSYQTIAEMLQISLNTVKTHVKNIYAKRRSCQDQETFWCCE